MLPDTPEDLQQIIGIYKAYAGDQSKLRIWRGGEKAHPELLEFMERGETRRMSKLLHHLWHDRVNMEFAEACMQAMFWHRGISG